MTRAARALSWLTLLLGALACGEDEPKPPTSPGPVLDADLPPIYEGGALEDRITLPPNPRDAAITEPTPILDLPLVIAQPSAPLSTSSLEVLVIGPAGGPVAEVAVSTGGPAVFTNALGLARVETVYGADFADVYAFGTGLTLGHARVSIRPGEASAVVVMVGRTSVTRIVDAAAATEIEVADEMDETSEVEGPPELRASFAAGSFELPWGPAAAGPAFVRAAPLRDPAEAGALPASMHALIDGAPTEMIGAMAFELRVAQGATEMALVRDAVVDLAWPSASAGLDRAALGLYFFDQKAGAFVPRGELDVSSDAERAIATIDRLGTWLIGVPAAATHCAQLAARVAGAPLPRASVLLASSSAFAAVRAELDEAGAACTQLPAASFAAHAFGLLDGVPATALGTVAAGALGSACDERCAAAPLEAELVVPSCARVMFSTPTVGSTVANMTIAYGGTTAVEPIVTHVPVCIDVRAGAELSVATATFTCGDAPITVAAAPAAGASCDTGGCLDLGSIACCTENEWCGDSEDSDCDGTVDEGCVCGGAACTPELSLDRCCAASGACGERSLNTGECVGYETDARFGCSPQTVETPSGGVVEAPGCCHSSGECGLWWNGFGCVAAADVPRAFGPANTLGSVACTP